MSRRLHAVIALLLLAAATMATARATPDSVEQGRGGQAVPSDGGGPIVVTGCVIREAAFARTTAAPSASDATADDLEFVLVDVDGSDAFSVTGIHEAALAEHLGHRVEARGTLEPARVTPVPPTGAVGVTPSAPATGAAGVAPSGSPAHEPGDALPGASRRADVEGDHAPPTRSDDASAVDPGELQRINISSARRVNGECDASIAAPRRTAAAAVDTGPTAPIPPVPDREQPITAIGCLLRWTPTGAALGAAGEALVLSGAVVPAERRTTPVSAVPGSLPSGVGSGTVPADPTTRPPGASSGAPERAFLLDVRESEVGELDRLAGLVGERVEIVGVAAADRSSAASEQPGVGASSAHSSAPTERLAVTSVRRVGGHCF